MVHYLREEKPSPDGGSRFSYWWGRSEVWNHRGARSFVVFGPFESELTQTEKKYGDANKPR